MIDAPTPTSTTDDARLELAMAAASSERANKPRWIIALGVVLILVAIIYTLASWSARSSKLSEVARARGAKNQVVDLKSQIDAVNARLAARGTQPNPRMGQAIEQSASSNGVLLAGPVGDSTQVAMTQLGMQQHKYTARAVNQEPAAVLKWLAAMQAGAETAVLEISRLRLTPGAGTAANTPGWNVDVEFSRWERIR